MVIADAADTANMLRRLAVQYHEACRSGRDDDLWAVQVAASDAWRSGVHHGDLGRLLIQIHLDSHALSAADDLLARAPSTTDTPTGQMLRAGIALQRGDSVVAGCTLLRLAADDPTWRTLALLASVYEELADVATADLLYAEAAQQLDAKQLTVLAWLECQRARLRLVSGVLERADHHLTRAEQAGPGWVVAAVRARWLEESGQLEAAANTRTHVAMITGRPDHAQAAAGCWSRVGHLEHAQYWQDRAASGFEAARARWPYRYAHHEVAWHLAAGRASAAVRIAEADYRERPAAGQVTRLVSVLRALGQGRRADLLMAGQEDRRLEARALLAEEVRVLNRTACAA